MSAIKHLNHNKQFLIGIIAMSFAVFCVVVLFLTLSFQQVKPMTAKGFYQVELTNGFVGDSTQVYVNDSLVFDGIIGEDSLKLQVKPFEEQHMLLVNDCSTQKTRSLNLPEEVCRVSVSKDEEGRVEFSLDRWEKE